MEGWVDLGYRAIAPAGNRTRDLSITSPTPYHYTTDPARLTVCGCDVQRVTAMRMELRLVRRVIHTVDSASVWTASLVVDVIAVCQASTASRQRDACVRSSHQPKLWKKQDSVSNENRVGLCRSDQLRSHFRAMLLRLSYLNFVAVIVIPELTVGVARTVNGYASSVAPS